MTNEQIRLIGYLYLLGFIVDLIWQIRMIADRGGFKAMIKEIADDAKVSHGFVIAVAIPVIALTIAAWPITMHFEISKGNNT